MKPRSHRLRLESARFVLCILGIMAAAGSSGDGLDVPVVLSDGSSSDCEMTGATVDHQELEAEMMAFYVLGVPLKLIQLLILINTSVSLSWEAGCI